MFRINSILRNTFRLFPTLLYNQAVSHVTILEKKTKVQFWIVKTNKNLNQILAITSN